MVAEARYEQLCGSYTELRLYPDDKEKQLKGFEQNLFTPGADNQVWMFTETVLLAAAVCGTRARQGCPGGRKSHGIVRKQG